MIVEAALTIIIVNVSEAQEMRDVFSKGNFPPTRPYGWINVAEREQG